MPAVPWFALRAVGPGMPEVTVGEFIWLSSVRYLVVPQWISDVFASFLLRPQRSGIVMRFDPGFCPAVAASAQEHNQRAQGMVMVEAVLWLGPCTQ